MIQIIDHFGYLAMTNNLFWHVYVRMNPYILPRVTSQKLNMLLVWKVTCRSYMFGCTSDNTVFQGMEENS